MGAWTYDDSGTTLTEDSYGFYATATVGGATSMLSEPFVVTVDRTGPTVSLSSAGTTSDLTPPVSLPVEDAPGAIWRTLANRLRSGGRGLAAGTSLLRLLLRHGRRQDPPSPN